MIPGAVERVFPHPGHVHLYNVFRLEFDEVEVCKDKAKTPGLFYCRLLVNTTFFKDFGTREVEKIGNRRNKLQNKQELETRWRATSAVHI